MNPKLVRNLLIGITAIWALVFVPCGGLALATAFLADGQVDPDVFAMIFFGSLSFPVAIVVLTPLAWVAYYFRRYGLALIVGLAPAGALLLPAIGFVMLMR